MRPYELQGSRYALWYDVDKKYGIVGAWLVGVLSGEKARLSPGIKIHPDIIADIRKMAQGRGVILPRDL